MSESVQALLDSVSSRLHGLRKYRAIYNRELALDFDPIGKFWGLYENPSSSILAFFLDPKETHAQGDAFLKAFLALLAQKMKCESLSKLALPSSVQTEFTIPNAGPNGGGRIDIVLFFEDPKYCIAIENKIGAPDQERQIDRYAEYLKNDYKGNNTLIYLTSDGRWPTEYSKARKKGEEEDSGLCLLSWRDDINRLLDGWLGLCHAESVRAFIKEFKQAIHQEMGGGLDMSEETTVVEQILKSDESLDAAASVVAAWASVHHELIGRVNIEMEKLAKAKGLVFNMTDSFGERYSSLLFNHESWKHFHIDFDFDRNNFRDMCYGISYINQPPDKHPRIKEALKVIESASKDDGHEKSEWLPVWYWMEPDFQNWDSANVDVMKNIMQGGKSGLYRSILQKIDYLRPIIDAAEKMLV
ncbi:MAG TPA: PD-(D/E)XK nuclease family protein [Rectinemataceae bacterium]|nr:PD-(D/E)XK nuclease family protein [Rectinemataceae bacterium]